MQWGREIKKEFYTMKMHLCSALRKNEIIHEFLVGQGGTELMLQNAINHSADII